MLALELLLHTNNHSPGDICVRTYRFVHVCVSMCLLRTQCFNGVRSGTDCLLAPTHQIKIGQ